MLLVPPETFISQLDPYTKKMSELDRKMEQILKRGDLDDFNKALQYQQTLNEYLSVRSQLLKPTPIPIVDNTGETGQPSIIKKDFNIHEDVLKSVPKPMRSKAERLVDLTERVPGLTWNHQGEMILNGKVFPGSHYVDLINDILRSRKNKVPVAWQEFSTALNNANVPHDLVGNPERWSYMRGHVTPIKDITFFTPDAHSDAHDSSLLTPPKSQRKAKKHSPLQRKKTKPKLNWDL